MYKKNNLLIDIIVENCENNTFLGKSNIEQIIELMPDSIFKLLIE